MENRIELGSEFNVSLNNLQIVDDSLFSYLSEYNVQWYDYGRSAIKCVPIPEGKIILLPEFICESVVRCFDEAYIAFYKIDEQFNIDLDDLLKKIDENVGCIYIAHYFGFLQSQSSLNAIKKAAEQYEVVIIEDTTQSLFSAHKLCGDYAVASVRKWMPVSMGGCLYTSHSKEVPEVPRCSVNTNNTKVYGMVLKDMFLKSGYDTNAKYREIFTQTENAIDEQTDICGISDLAKFLISCVSISNLIETRIDNMQRLHRGLKKLGISGIREYKEGECPLAYPLRVNNRDAFRHYLMENRIYCAVHWPFDGFKAVERQNAIKNANSIISLPIDQRYGAEEIDYLLNVIEKYGGELTF